VARYDIGVVRILLVRGDITLQNVDVVVNAANEALLPGGGVDGAITRAAGAVALAERVRMIRERGSRPLPTGTAVATTGGDLKARWIIHTAGPVYSGVPEDPRLLAACHTATLTLAEELGAATVAFPAISTGTYGYPAEEAAGVAIAAVAGSGTTVREVRFVLLDERMHAAFRGALESRP